MRNITTPTKAVSFEDALRNLAAKLTGKPAASLPRTQEAVVQYMAENVPSVDELAGAVTREVMARIAPTAAEEPQNGEPEGSDTPEPQEASEEPQEAPKARKRKTKTD
jgi:hypothetical protein